MKCAHCATSKAERRWHPAICADKRKRRSKWLCTPCDLLLNRLVLEFFNDKDADRKMAEYSGGAALATFAEGDEK